MISRNINLQTPDDILPQDDWLQKVLDQGMPDKYKPQSPKELEECPTPDLNLDPLDLASDQGTADCPRGSTPIPQEILDACFDVLGAKNEVFMFDLTKYLEKQKILQIRVCLLNIFSF